MFRFWKKKPGRKKRFSEEERRREPRYEDLNDLTIEPIQPEKLGVQKRSYFARTKDASPSGLRIECEVRFPLNTKLSLKLESRKTGRVIEAEGTVKWAARLKEEEKFEIGINFVDTSVKTIMELLEHIYKA
jgi:hypothetical protein